MFGKIWLIVVFFVFFAAGGYSQITITEDQVAFYNAVGTTSVSNLDTVTTSVNIGSTTGVNTWDFSGLVSNLNFVTTSVDPISTPYHSTFPNSTICRKYTVSFMGINTNIWLYNSIDANGFYLDGEVTVTSFIMTFTNTTTNSPSEIQIKLPLTLGTTWSQDYTSTISSEGGTTVTNYHVVYTVDAYGSLKLPGVSGNLQALRLKREEISTMGQLYDHYIGYIFMTENGSGASIAAADTLQPDHGVINVMSSAWVVASVTSVEENENLSSKDFMLHQNYPNPFNPVTTISWKSSAGGRQVLKVYNILGKEVATLLDEYRPAGDYEIKFDGSTLPSGVYIYRLTTRNFSDSKKLILMK